MLANPGANLPSETNADADDYPFSMQVQSDRLFSATDMMNLQRDHYEGTPYRFVSVSVRYMQCDETDVTV